MDLLRFSTAGSVDDGKSTLIGRLLYDAKGVFADQLEAVTRASTQAKGSAGGAVDLSLLTDGLRAEREQGITIDVAYRFFATPKRKFIIADTPGHEQYTRNMATGASTAQLAVVLLDARHGVLVQSRRHTTIASLLGIRHLVVAVNKMDLVDWSQPRFEAICADFRAFCTQIGASEPIFVPLSALTGDNVVLRSERMPWYDGPSLLEHLETVPTDLDAADAPFRLPVQLVIRPHLDYRGFAGQIASGTVRVGDELLALPAGTRARVRAIDTFDGALQQASAPQAVTLLLDDEIDVSRGDMLVPVDAVPWIRNSLDADVVWMDATPLDPARGYLLKHTSRTVPVRVTAVHERLDVVEMRAVAAERLGLNEIGRLRLQTTQPLFVDPYAACRSTGAFILIDPVSNATVAAGMVRSEQQEDGRVGIVRRVDAAARAAHLGHRAGMVCVRGGSRDVRQQVVVGLEAGLFQRGVQALAWPDDAGVPLADGASLLMRAGMIVLVSEDRGTLSTPEAGDAAGAPFALTLELVDGEAAPDRGGDGLQISLQQGVDRAIRAGLLALRDRELFGSRRTVDPGGGI